VASPGSEHAPTSELSDATTAETSSFVRPVSDTSPRRHHSQPQQQQQAIVIVEQPPTPVVQPSPPTSLPLSDNQSAGRVRSADRLSPRLQPATITSDSLEPVAEEDMIVADDNNAGGPAVDADEVFSPAAVNDDDDVEVKSQTGLSVELR